MADRGGEGDKEVLLEFQRIGNAVKVVAMDPETLVEVTIMGPPGAGEEALSRIAMRKLEYVLNKRKTER
jgi:hypothetical protein